MRYRCPGGSTLGPPSGSVQTGRPGERRTDVTDWFDQDRATGDPLDPAIVVEAGNVGAILDVVRLGAMVSVSLTRDEGAVRIAVTNDGKSKAEYFRDPMELGSWLVNAHKAVTAQRANGGRGGTAPPR